MHAETPPPHPGDVQTVTASTLVRQFGLWQQRATRAPVYVLHHGRPRLALTSIELIEAMCGARDRPAAAAIEPLLDAVRELVVIVDGDLTVTRLSAAARRYFGDRARPGAPLERLVPGPAADFLLECVGRVIERGIGEAVEVASPCRPERRLSIDLEPWPNGAALFARDGTTEDELRDARGHARAIDQALAAVEQAATVRLDLHGCLDQPTPSLAAFTGRAAETLAKMRFVTLLDIASHNAVSAAIEAVIADGRPRSVRAEMPGDHGMIRPIRIGFSLLRRGGAPDGVAAIVIGNVPLPHDE